MSTSKVLTYKYEFCFSDGSGTKSFIVELDAATLSLVIKEDSDIFKRALVSSASYHHDESRWTRLDFHRCGICPLSISEAEKRFHGLCPAALAVFEAVDFFKDKISYEDVTVKITSPLRGYFKKTKIQEGLSSLLGLLMASSGCPVLEKLRPMLIVHLPFARSYETVYRVASMYLLAQYFIKKNSAGVPDWEMNNLVKIYEDVRKVNKSFAERILSAVQKDAGSNALVILDCLAASTTIAITRSEMKELETFFEPYLKK